MKNLFKRSLAAALALIMCVSMLNLTAFAADSVPSGSPHHFDNGYHYSSGRYHLVKKATCTEPAQYAMTCDADHHCRECGMFGNKACWKDSTMSGGIDEGSRISVGEPLGHDYQVVEGSAKPATCTEDGSTGDYMCTRCGDVKKGESIAQTGHNWSKETVGATCIQKGETIYHCANDSTHDYAVEGAYGDHSWGEWTVTKEPTCTEKGEKSHTCSVCNKTESVEVDAAGHKPVAGTAQTADCKHGSHDGGLVCSVCKITLEAPTSTGDPVDHDWGDWQQEAGNATQHKHVCSYYPTEHIAYANHEWGTEGENHDGWVYTEWADVVENGAVTGQRRTATRVCDDCGYTLNADWQNPQGADVVRTQGKVTVNYKYVVAGESGEAGSGTVGQYLPGQAYSHTITDAELAGFARTGYTLTVDQQTKGSTATKDDVEAGTVELVFTLTYKINKHDLTVKYEGVPEGTEVDGDSKTEVEYGTPITKPAAPEVPGYKVEVTGYPTDGKMPDEPVEITVKYTIIEYTLVINYLNAQNEVVADQVNRTVKITDNLSVKSPDVDKYVLADSKDATITVDATRIAGAKDNKIEINVFYRTAGTKGVKVQYVDELGEVVGDPVVITGLELVEGDPERKTVPTNGVPAGYNVKDGQNPSAAYTDPSDEDGNVTVRVVVEAIEYNVYWVSEGTTVNSGTFTVKTGVPAANTYTGTPRKGSDGAYTYTFSGWSDGVTDDKGNVTYTALFSRTRISTTTPEPPQPIPTPTPEPSEPVEIDEPETPLGPLPELPEEPEEPVEIDEPETPLGPLPELPEQPEQPELPDEVEVEDPDVPLAAVPQTGDNTVLWATTAVASGAGLIWLAVDGKKRREDAE